MEFLHEVIERNGRVLDRLISREAGLSIEINRTGAEMVSLQKLCGDGVWRGYLVRDGDVGAPAAGWANHATVMGYFLHRLWQEKSVYRGREIRGGNHGFLRHFEFHAPEVSADRASLVYRVAADQIPPEAYPLRVELELSFSILPDGALEVRFAFHNLETELSAHVSFGLHPGFAVAHVDQAIIHLPPGRYERLMAPGNFLNGDAIAFEHPGGPMPFDVKDLPGSFLLDLAGVPERVFSVTDPVSGRTITLDFQDCPYLTIWSEGPDFVCVEPCWGLPDSNPPVPFEEKKGIQIIPPAGKLTKAFLLRPSWHDPAS